MFLTWAVEHLALEQVVAVIRSRAEELAHLPRHREAFDLVVARGFGPPAVTGECASGLLRVGGRLLVSEPPNADGSRWTGLDTAGLGLVVETVAQLEVGSFVVIRKLSATPDQFPRRGAALSKRPLF